MDIRFLPHNSHLRGIDAFWEQDPNLSVLRHQYYVNTPELLGQLPTTTPGIYTLGGGRQIGKTTLAKQWMAKLLSEGTEPKAIAFISGEMIEDYHSLLYIVQTQLADMPADTLKFFIIDEITYIKDWDRAIKYAADAGLLNSTVLLLTGSDMSMMQDARITFPGRRGKADKVDFHIYPLSFRECIILKKTLGDEGELNAFLEQPTPEEMSLLYEEFNQYLMHGGYLTAINDLAINKQISTSTLGTYSDWIRGDVVKRKKNEIYLREILGAIIQKYNSQITWNAMIDNLTIEHPQTVIEYCQLLERMDALFIQYALVEDKLLPAIKKAKKLFFTDPFIYHALFAWLHSGPDPYHTQIQETVKDPEQSTALVESCVVTHFRRFFPTYYIKAEGEVDVAYIKQKRFWPIEIKWRNQLRPKDLKQIKKYPNSCVYAKITQPQQMDDLPAIPLPLALLELTD